MSTTSWWSRRRAARAVLLVVAVAELGLAPAAGATTDDPTEPRPALLNADGASEAFSGVAQILGLGPSCSGFLVDTGNPTGAAMVMTNGHCAGLFDAVTILESRPAPEDAVARFRAFVDTPDTAFDVPVATISNATMRSTDVAVVELDTTLASLVERGIAAYDLGPPPADGDDIRVVGVPVDGIDATEHVLRGATCTAGATVRLVEFEWLWDAAVASDCAGMRGGSSGSPVFSADDASTVVAIVNTTTIGAGPGGSCYLGQPCEVGPDGDVQVENQTYAMPIDEWGSCFQGSFDAALDGCPVERAPSVLVDAPQRAAQPGATWSASISATGWDGGLLVKTGPAASTDCRDAGGYGVAPSVDGIAAFDEPAPTDEGVYVLCAATADATGAAVTGSAGYAVMQIDATAPTMPIELSVRAEPGHDAHVEPIFSPPELSSFEVKVGPREGTDCDDLQGYALYRRIPIVVPHDQQPAVVCVVGEDEAGNRGQPQRFDVPS